MKIAYSSEKLCDNKADETKADKRMFDNPIFPKKIRFQTD